MLIRKKTTAEDSRILAWLGRARQGMARLVQGKEHGRAFPQHTNKQHHTMKTPPPLPDDSPDDGTALVGCLLLFWTFVIGILVGVLLKS